MALARKVADHFEYTVPQTMIIGIPIGAVYRHFAWFHRLEGHWLAEWAGHVPSPDINPTLIGESRLMALNQWQQEVIKSIFLGECDELQSIVDVMSWDACEPEGAVCLDVTQFNWPVGDHRWHEWNDVSHSLDWKQARKFIEIEPLDSCTMRIVANQSSHRPVRAATQNRRIGDVTELPFSKHHGNLFGLFVKQGDKWLFSSLKNDRILPTAAHKELEGSPINMDSFISPQQAVGQL